MNYATQSPHKDRHKAVCEQINWIGTCGYCHFPSLDLVFSEALWVRLSPPDCSLSDCIGLSSSSSPSTFFSILLRSFFCPSLEALQNSKSQLLPHHSTVEVLFCDGCCLQIISNPMLLMSLHQSVLQGDARRRCPLCSCVSPPREGLTGEDPQQQSHLCCWIFYLFQMVINAFEGFTHGSPLSTIAQFVRISSSRQIHMCDILPQIVNNGFN